MPKMIVSANYRDRKSEYPWLVRREDQSPVEAQPFKHVDAIGVNFEYSSAYEAGFGCSLVAYCETAACSNEPTVNMADLPPTRLKFDFVEFLDDQGRHVDTCKRLVLGADRLMYAVVAESSSQFDDPIPAGLSGWRYD